MDNYLATSFRLYSLRDHLAALISQWPQFKMLQTIWEIDSENYREILQGVVFHYPMYTLHDEAHSNNIISKIEMFLGQDAIQCLGPTDTWMILESAYAHDIGMNLSEEQVSGIWFEARFQRYLDELRRDEDEDIAYLDELEKNESARSLQSDWPNQVSARTLNIIAEYFRKQHAKDSEQKLHASDDRQSFEIIGRRLYNLIGKISRLHQMDAKDIEELLPQETNGYGNDYAHPRFIAFLLRLGDLFDLDAGRMNPYHLKLSKIPIGSRPYIDNQHAIENLLISPHEIKIEANCKTKEGYLAMKDWLYWIQGELHYASTHWQSIKPRRMNMVLPQLQDIVLRLNGEKIDTRLENMNFAIDLKRIADIVEGGNIYKHKFSFIREIISNAFDASKRQFWRDCQSGSLRYIKKDAAGLKKSPLLLEEDRDLLNFLEYYSVNVQLSYVILNDKSKKPNGEESRFVCIQVYDNGVGFNIDTLYHVSRLETYVSTIDNYIREKEIPAFFQATGSFGIGLQSVFLITDRLYILSGYPETEGRSKALAAEIKSGRTKKEGDLFYKLLDAPTPTKGTCVTVFLSACDELASDIADYLEIYKTDLQTDAGSSADLPLEVRFLYSYIVKEFLLEQKKTAAPFQLRVFPLQAPVKTDDLSGFAWDLKRLEHIKELETNRGDENGRLPESGGMKLPRGLHAKYPDDIQFIYVAPKALKIKIWNQDMLIEITPLGSKPICSRYVFDAKENKCSVFYAYKGAYVFDSKEHPLSYPLLDLSFDDYRGDVKNILNVDRNSLKFGAINNIKKILEDALRLLFNRIGGYRLEDVLEGVAGCQSSRVEGVKAEPPGIFYQITYLLLTAAVLPDVDIKPVLNFFQPICKMEDFAKLSALYVLEIYKKNMDWKAVGIQEFIETLENGKLWILTGSCHVAYRNSVIANEFDDDARRLIVYSPWDSFSNGLSCDAVKEIRLYGDDSGRIGNNSLIVYHPSRKADKQWLAISDECLKKMWEKGDYDEFPKQELMALPAQEGFAGSTLSIEQIRKVISFVPPIPYDRWLLVPKKSAVAKWGKSMKPGDLEDYAAMFKFDWILKKIQQVKTSVAKNDLQNDLRQLLSKLDIKKIIEGQNGSDSRKGQSDGAH